MARRLVEAGARFVTVHCDASDGYSWDSHVHSDDVKDHLLPTTDQALPALLDDLDERGLLDETLVVVLGEMGRTPKANATLGPRPLEHPLPRPARRRRRPRRHLLRPLRRGGRLPHRAPVRPEDLAATLYWALGLDPELTVPDPQGRPTRLVEDGTPVTALFG